MIRIQKFPTVDVQNFICSGPHRGLEGEYIEGAYVLKGIVYYVVDYLVKEYLRTQ